MSVSIIIPVLNDAAVLEALLRELRPIRSVRAGPASAKGRPDEISGTAVAEIIVVDGGSGDDSVAVAERADVHVLWHCPGRGLQLDAGARAAQGAWMWFVHADSRVSPEIIGEVCRLSARAPGWGRFDVSLAGPPLLRLTAMAMNWRAAATGICTGDQGIFVHRSLLDAVGGVPRQRLMEDIELSRRLKRLARPIAHSRPHRCVRAALADPRRDPDPGLDVVAENPLPPWRRAGAAGAAIL